MFNYLLNALEKLLRSVIVFITDYLPVKVIRDDHGRPFLYRYHLFSLTNDGPGLCIHHFTKSDPDRGYHDHPWTWSLSFILCGGYTERVLNDTDPNQYQTYNRKRWTFNRVNGHAFHRVLLKEGSDAWTLFAFRKRNKTWNMISLDGKHHAMSNAVEDQDGGWWNTSGKGLGVHSHLPHSGKVISTVDTIIIAGRESKVLLIKRGKEPFKDCWAFPGGRIEQKDRDILDAAYRELQEETGLTDVNLEYCKTVGNSTRDPRGFCATNVFVGKLPEIPTGIKAGDDAVDYQWFDMEHLPEMAFDHRQILDDIIFNKRN